jgi:hypothetical protein
VDSDEEELFVDEPMPSTTQNNADQVETPLEVAAKLETPNAATRKRRVENPTPVVVKSPVKTTQVRPASPRRALLIDLPAQNPQRKLRTTRLESTKMK